MTASCSTCRSSTGWSTASCGRRAMSVPGYRLSTDRDDIQVDAVHAYLASSYWATGYPAGGGRAGDPRLDLCRRVRRGGPDRLCAGGERRGDLCLSRRRLCSARRIAAAAWRMRWSSICRHFRNSRGCGAGCCATARRAWLVRIARLVARHRSVARDAAALPRRLSGGAIMSLRPDLAIIADHVAAGRARARRRLRRRRADGGAARRRGGVDARGMEIDPANVASAVRAACR